MLRQLVFAAAVSVASAGFAETLGFWDFRDGEPGTDVSTVANASGTESYTSATAQKTHATNGQLPKFNADSPGRIKDGLGGPVLCENPQSIDFRYVSRSTRQGGYIDLDGVADDISGKGSFTIEYFVKQNADYSYYETGDGDWDQRSKTMLYLESRTGFGAFKQIMPYTVDKTTKHGKDAYLETFLHGSVAGKSMGKAIDLCDDKWHHVAIVYTETDATAKTGKIAFYWDQAKVNETDYLNDPEGTTRLKLRIGTGYKNQKGEDKTTTEPVNASISALRVSNAALAVSDFLYGPGVYDVDPNGTIALLTFAGKTAGESADSVAYDATDCEALVGSTGTGIALKSIDQGCVPAYNDDIPGRYLFSSSSRERMLATDYKSLKFTSSGEGTSRAENYQGVGGGCVNFPNLGTVLSCQQSYTIEMFVKDEDWSEWQWESGLFYFNSKTNNATFNNQCNVSSVKAGKTSWYVNMQGRSQANKSTTWKDGLWHHVALVFDGDTGKQTMYLDYKPGTSVDYENGAALDQRFVLGCRDNNANYTWHGKIAGVRIVPRALAVADFMVAEDYKIPSGTVFSVNFNEGAGQDGQSFVSALNQPVAVSAILSAGKEALVAKYGLHSAAYPQFAEGKAVRAERMISWGKKPLWQNLAGCHFLGYGSLPSGTANRNYAGTELCVPGSTDSARNPASWTMEAFVKPEYDNLDNMLLFGKAALANQHASPKKYPECCWLLLRHKSGMLELRWTEQAADPSYQYTVDSKDYYKAVLTPTAIMKDHRWYHVALTYDKPTKTFKLYVNYQLVLTQVTSGLELFDSTHDYFFSRINAANGFEGWMDEIRFSDSALEPSSFETIEKFGLILFCR